ncbi:MAG TPA: tol-pal system protein YbgF [Polyangia bacterium]|nr:tol-pal system protein YbgF [Polyangia bacterium]
MAADRLTLTFSLLVSVGCATAPPAKTAGSSDFDRTMVELRAQNAGFLRQVDELQNKIFMLEDALESQRLADEQRTKPPRLVSRRIGVAVAEVPEPTTVVAQTFEGEESTVEYAGEAALPVRRERVRAYARPLLRLSGSGGVATISVASPRSGDGAAPDSVVSTASLHLYRQSLKELQAGRVARAVTGFRKFLARYPHHNYADNAQYWIGEGYYDLKQFHSSAREFRRVVERYPRGNKVPEAMLKLGLSQFATGERRDGRRVLEVLRRMYPKQAAARLASERLAQAGDDPAEPTASLETPPR